MAKSPYLGEFEQQMLLVILRLGSDSSIRRPDPTGDLQT
jgi:hypothetical protein